MDKIKHFKLIGILFIAMLTNISNLKAQGTCISSLNLDVGQTFDTSYVINDNVLWLQFQASNQNINTYFNSSNSNILELELYSGTCNNLISLQQVYDTIINYSSNNR